MSQQQINVTAANGVATIKLEGRFDFNMQRDFRTAYTPYLQDNATHTIRMDMSGVSYLDSSALGLLMLLRERAQEANKSVVLSQPNDTVRKILDIANFGKLFKME